MTNVSAGSREVVLGLLNGRRGERVPCFSGLINVTAAGLEGPGWQFSELHADAAKMAAAAASTWRLFGWESAVAPLDLCVEAEALGAQIDFRAGSPRPLYPTVERPLAESARAFDLMAPAGFATRGRVPVVVESIARLKAEVGREVAVGAWVPGPMTLAMQVVDLTELLAEVASAPEAVGRVLDALVDPLIEVALAYRAAGADFLTVHEMGGSPGVVGPRSFEQLVQPRLKRLLGALPVPRVLSVCGDTNRAMPLLAACGAEALSVDQLNDLARSRQTLGPDALLFGNIDPVGVLANGDDAAVRASVRGAIRAGADAVWPGCDLWPVVPRENMRAMREEVNG